ncbi:endonuclease III [Anaerolineales bacterium HSG24]|nr:endonuclease III [Anaerolineales bacterium HSG24]
MQTEQIYTAIQILRQEVTQWPPALVDGMALEARDPYKILIATILSLRTKDTLTEKIAPKLFAMADTPTAMLTLSADEIAELIYPVGFYRNKAKTIISVSRILLDQHDGQVPDELDALLALPGVGRKTANLVLIAGFNKPGICVDIHVHRISNRWGYVETKTPEKTEFALRNKLPPKYWLEYNALLVVFGQNLCTPVSPWCSKCKLTELCDQVGVTKHR